MKLQTLKKQDNSMFTINLYALMCRIDKLHLFFDLLASALAEVNIKNIDRSISLF